MDDQDARTAAGNAVDSHGTRETENLPAEEEPVMTGTLVILMLFMMALGALWILMYFTMLER